MSNPNLPSQLTFHGNGGTFPAYGNITKDDHGPVVVTFNWIFYCMTGLAVIARFATRRNWTTDSFLMLGAVLLLTGESVSVHIAASNGLGRRFRSLDEETYEKYSKAFYASQILKILTLTVVKMSYIFIFQRLISASSDRMKHMNGIFHALQGLFVAWGIGTMFAFAFQCSVPRPWDSVHNTCTDRATLYYVTGIINMMTDLAIIAMPAVIVYSVRLKKYERITIMGIFATRIFTVAAAAVELGYMSDYLWGSDPTWQNESATIWGQAMLNLSLLTACVPLMKPFFDKLQFSLVDSSTLPFSAQAGMYHENHRDTSPLWSREKRSGASGSGSGSGHASSGNHSNTKSRAQQQWQQQQQARAWKVSQAPPRASWKEQQQAHRQANRQQHRVNQQQQHRGHPPPPISQYAPSLEPGVAGSATYVPTGYSPHCSVGVPSVDYGRPSEETLVMGRGVTDPRW